METNNPNPSRIKPKYKVSMRLGTETQTKSGETILEALELLEKPIYFKTKGIISVKFGKQFAEIYMWPILLRKLFVNQTSRLLLEKRLLSALK